MSNKTTISKKTDNGKGQPRKFKDGNELFKKFEDYIEFCHNIGYLPNVAGFCRFCKINRDTYYASKEYYSDTFKEIEGILEDEALNCQTINDTLKIFYMKNKFSSEYKDRQEIDVTERYYDVEG